MFETQAMSSVIVSPGAIGALSGIDITVRSSVLPSSGAMNVILVVRSAAGSAPPVIFTLEMSQIEDMLSFGKPTPAGKIADALVFAVRCADHPRQDNTTVCVVKIP